MNETDEQINFEMFDQKSADEKDDCSDTIIDASRFPSSSAVTRSAGGSACILSRKPLPETREDHTKSSGRSGSESADSDG